MCMKAKHPNYIGAVVGGIFATLVVIAILVVAVILNKRRVHVTQSANQPLKEQHLNTEQEDSNTEERCGKNNSGKRSSLHDESLRKTNTIKTDDVEGYYNIGKVAQMRTTENSVFLSQLKEYVTSCLADDEFFTRQFSKIPRGLQYSTTVAKKRGNMSKNRYKAMYAYDHSRVVLDTLSHEQDSDYINASFIQGYLTDNAYIASHGPIDKTLEDFWRMIWEKNVSTIVMLTKLVEGRTIKCIQYWTKEGTSSQIGDIIIYTEAENVFSTFTVRRLRISNVNNPGKERVITQHHYTAWPDKNVPRTTTSLLEFWHRVRQNDATKSHPWLVHCSAGVGRTGTFIAIDKLYDQAIDQGFIDIFQCVKDLREQRVNMVQTKNQYMFLHKIMLEILVLWSPPVKCEEFIDAYAELTKEDDVTHKTKLLLQFEALKDYTLIESQSVEVYEEIDDEDGRPSDIKVLYLPSYTTDNSFIFLPFDSNSVQYLQLVDKQEVNLIVALSKGMKGESKILSPAKDPRNIGPYTISVISTKYDSIYTERWYSFKVNSQERVIKQLEYNSSAYPSDPLDMLRFIQAINIIRDEDKTKRTLIQSLDANERGGLIVVLVNIFERIKFDNEVSIPQVIQQLRSFQGHIVQHFDQFKFCYEVVKRHIEDCATYANT
ncbi:receptor-type tyrosine-protein phosphatase alpha-like [Ruditapes philippinarum]|uniref:receptor-type tyrosine-protein phosphatase alpha-like n=1 Tax=Ruditapes philippinarum TaxID=129788 RepID=UPI00295BDF31|nr:receptor-type tyrosine-protein phosphatase alpha-like [Ruditapes philippinarum]